MGGIEDAGEALRFLWIIQRIHEGALRTLQPQIQKWLEAL
jgi:hypothetical protein